nr:hypothetical protein BgiMline_005821 [Biomphalaria glabrata]
MSAIFPILSDLFSSPVLHICSENGLNSSIRKSAHPSSITIRKTHPRYRLPVVFATSVPASGHISHPSFDLLTPHGVILCQSQKHKTTSLGERTDVPDDRKCTHAQFLAPNMAV